MLVYAAWYFTPQATAMWRQVTFRRLPRMAVNASASVRRYAHNVMIGDNTALENM